MSNPNKHEHLKGLIDLFADKPLEEVQVIVIRPIDPPELGKDAKGQDTKYDRTAYVFGRGLGYTGKFKHQENCVWVDVP